MATDGGDLAPETLADRVEAGERVAVLDVRNREEVEAWAIEGDGVEHTHVPYVRFVSEGVTGDVADLVDSADSYVAVCPRGEASAEVAGMLRDAGVEAVNLAGGLHAWARVYRSTELATDATEATVVQYRRPATGCLAYAVRSDGEALLVDPLRAMADRYASDLAGYDVSVCDTHLHADHVSGLRRVAEEMDARALLPQGTIDRGVTYDVEPLADGDELAVGDATVTVRETPGHTTGAVSLVVDDALLLSGDTLFIEGTPRPDLQEGETGAADLAGTLYDTLTERLATLPDDVLVAPGHYEPGTPLPGDAYVATMGTLRDRLATFSESREAFVDRVTGSLGERPANFADIVDVNRGVATADAERAFEMELGPNNCAVSD